MVTYVHTHGLHEADDVRLRQPPASPVDMYWHAYTPTRGPCLDGGNVIQTAF